LSCAPGHDPPMHQGRVGSKPMLDAVARNHNGLIAEEVGSLTARGPGSSGEMTDEGAHVTLSKKNFRRQQAFRGGVLRRKSIRRPATLRGSHRAHHPRSSLHLGHLISASTHPNQFPMFCSRTAIHTILASHRGHFIVKQSHAPTTPAADIVESSCNGK
jgi:hypothetical protein